jgi:hypothetical protein
VRLRLPYRQPRFEHLEEMEWRDVLAQDHSGTRKVVQEKWLSFEPRCLAFVGKWDPGMVVAQHGHMCPNSIYVVEGSMESGGVECTKGMNIMLDVGTPYGPNVTGPDGVLVYEVMGGNPSVWYADPEGFAALKRERGIKQLANPALETDEGSSETRATYDDTGMLIAPIAARPARPYRRPRFCHSDDVEWREVLAQEQDGRRVSAWEKWLDFSPQAMCTETRLDPGMIIPPRGRNCIQTLLVLEGSMTVGERECTRGMHIMLEVGTPLPTVVVGPEGVELYEVRLGDPTAWYVHEHPFDELEFAHGAVPLPAPRLDLPAWLEDRDSIYD